MNEEELDLAPNVEDIVEGDDDNDPILTIKSISSASRKQVGVVRKFDEVEHDDDDDDNQDNVPNKRKCNIIR
ncbi:unnamed protein product, partial [Rotaria magnacalcarata]